MEIIEKVLSNAFIIKPKILTDERGYFYESYNQQLFEKIIGEKVNFVQDNQSFSSKGTLRGIHFQTGEASQAKLVRVVKGSIYDVAVDLRPESPTFKKWHAIELSETNNLQFFIPKGFGHAFVALENNTIVQYKVDNYYVKEMDLGIHWSDKDLNIEWPKIDLSLSKKDFILPTINQLDFRKLWKK